MEFLAGEVPSDAPVVDLAALYRVVDELAAGVRNISYTGPPGAPPDGDPRGGASVEGSDWALDEGPDAVEVVMAAWDDRLRGVPCGICAKVDQEGEMLVCDRCGVPFHSGCQPLSPAGDGPWYCSQCRGIIRVQGSSDPVEDLELLDYLFRGILPDDLDLAARVRRLSGHYRGRGQELETLANPYGVESLQRWVSVPPIPMRPDIVRDTHEATGHVGRAKLAEALLAAYWWPGLRAQVAREVARCPMC